MLKIGIYSGSFNPVHMGHIAFACQALETGLDRVIFIPEAQPRRKPDVAPVQHRLRMLELATAGQSDFSVIELKSRRFTVDKTLPELELLFPGAHLTLIVGSDVVKSFPNWEGLEKLRRTMDIIVGLRGRAAEPEVARQLKDLQFEATCISLDPLYSDVSSSDIRGSAYRVGLPAEVARYITDHKLYEL